MFSPFWGAESLSVPILNTQHLSCNHQQHRGYSGPSGSGSSSWLQRMEKHKAQFHLILPHPQQRVKTLYIMLIFLTEHHLKLSKRVIVFQLVYNRALNGVLISITLKMQNAQQTSQLPLHCCSTKGFQRPLLEGRMNSNSLRSSKNQDGKKSPSSCSTEG